MIPTRCAKKKLRAKKGKKASKKKEGNTNEKRNNKPHIKMYKEASKHKDSGTNNKRDEELRAKMDKEASKQKDCDTNKKMEKKRKQGNSMILEYSKRRELDKRCVKWWDVAKRQLLDSNLFRNMHVYLCVTWTIACIKWCRFLLDFWTKLSYWQ